MTLIIRKIFRENDVVCPKLKWPEIRVFVVREKIGTAKESILEPVASREQNFQKNCPPSIYYKDLEVRITRICSKTAGRFTL